MIDQGEENDTVTSPGTVETDGLATQADAQAQPDISGEEALSADPKPDSAESSTAQDAGKDKDLLAVARKVVPQKPKPAQGSSPDKPEAESRKTAGPRDPDDFSDVPFHKHPRFQDLISRLDHYKRGATQFQQVRGFLDNYGIADAEAANALQFVALQKTNPVEAWKMAKPVIENLLLAAGEILPPDLVQMVQQQRLTREAAMEISRTRAAMRGVQATAQHSQQAFETARKREFESSVRTAIGSWETDMQTRDPDFAKKQQFVRDRMVALVQQHGFPQNADQAVGMARQAHKDVTVFLRSAVPAKPKVTPAVGGRVAAAPAPSGGHKSLMDAARAALGR